jgi:hypothetical protein
MKAITILALAGLAAGPAAVRAGDEKEPSAKTREAVKKLKEDLTAFAVSIYTFPPKDRGGTTDTIQLVADPKRIPPKAERVFPITEKQAVSVIDYLADNGWFDRVYIPPPGILPPGWYVYVSGGKPPPGSKVPWGYQWAYGRDVKPGTVGIIQHLVKTLDGDAKAAVEHFREDADKDKR